MMHDFWNICASINATRLLQIHFSHWYILILRHLYLSCKPLHCGTDFGYCFWGCVKWYLKCKALCHKDMPTKCVKKWRQSFFTQSSAVLVHSLISTSFSDLKGPLPSKSRFRSITGIFFHKMNNESVWSQGIFLVHWLVQNSAYFEED